MSQEKKTDAAEDVYVPVGVDEPQTPTDVVPVNPPDPSKRGPWTYAIMFNSERTHKMGFECLKVDPLSRPLFQGRWTDNFRNTPRLCFSGEYYCFVKLEKGTVRHLGDIWGTFGDACN